MYNHTLYLLYWAGNSIVLLFGNLFFPEDVVLGNYRFSLYESAIYAGFWATVLLWSMWDFVYVRKVFIEKLSARFLVFWAFNFSGFWLVSRFAHIAGFGVSSFWMVLILSFFAQLLQKLSWKLVSGKTEIGYSG